jgi:gluconolactonase
MHKLLFFTFAASLFFIDTTPHSYLSSAKLFQSPIPPIVQKDTTGLIASGATLQRISNQFAFTEGPAVDSVGNIFFTDQPHDNIWKWETDGTLSLFKHGTGRANGLYIDENDNILACADEKNMLELITPEKEIRVLYKARKHKRLNGPNDLWLDARGGIYITDPYYQRPYWKRKKPTLKGQYVYYLPPGKKKLITVEETLKQPNGIVGTPDGKQLFVADIGAGKTYKYDISPNGLLQSKQLFVAQGSDGLTLDNRGNLYITGDGVTVYNPAGQKIEHIPVPAKWTSNVCFGGREKNKLFITASEAVYVIQMNVKGVE